MTEQAIIGAESVDPRTLTPFHKNPRRGDVDAIAEAMSELGQYKPIVVNKGTLTGRPNEILAGNHTHQATLRLDLQSIDVVYVDVDDDTAARIVLTDNRTGDLGTYDNDVLFERLGALQSLTATGFTKADYDDILAELNPTPAAPHQPGRSQEGVNTFDRREQYEAAETRGVLLDYSLDDYDAVTANLDELRKRHGAKDNAETVLLLLEAATGETAPEDEL